jgi:RNA polymerase sigma-70 factor (ECF subfamily)
VPDVPTDQSGLLKAIHDAYAPDLLRFALRLTGDPIFAQDVVQEALLRAWKHPAILAQSDDSARAWLFTVVRNIVIDDRRSARRAREILTDDPPDKWAPDAAEGLFDAWVLSDALASLSLEHRTAVVSAYYLGQSVAEIARQNGLPEGTVKSRLHYALRAMRLALQERGVTR